MKRFSLPNPSNQTFASLVLTFSLFGLSFSHHPKPMTHNTRVDVEMKTEGLHNDPDNSGPEYRWSY
jgi:hypothetical protein